MENKRSNANHKPKHWVIASLCAALVVTNCQFAFGQSLTIRTLAGGTNPGATNGFGSNARFNLPLAVGADGTGNVYVVDTLNSSVRKVTPNGYATTLAGQPGNPGAADGTGSSAQFYGPEGIASDVLGQLYI